MTKYTLNDLAETAGTLRMLREDLTDMMNELCDEWRAEVIDLIKKKNSGTEPVQEEIDALVEWHQEICNEEAYPPLLP